MLRSPELGEGMQGGRGVFPGVAEGDCGGGDGWPAAPPLTPPPRGMFQLLTWQGQRRWGCRALPGRN